MPTGPDTPKAGITSYEARFELARKTTGLFLGPVLFVVLWFYPMPALTPEAHRLAAVVGFVIVFWMTEPVHLAVTALLGPALAVICGCVPLPPGTDPAQAHAVLRGSSKLVFAHFGNPIIFLFIGSFFLAKAMQVHGLERKFSLSVLSIPFFRRNTTGLLLGIGLPPFILSMWISNTATTAMMYPIILGIISVIEDSRAGEMTAEERKFFGSMIMLMCAYAASAGGVGTPVGTPPNLIGIGQIEKVLDFKISFFQWMLFAVPITTCMFLGLWAILRYRIQTAAFKGETIKRYVADGLSSLGPWTQGQRNTLFCFAIAVSLWTAQGIAGIWQDSSLTVWFHTRLPESTVALIAGLLLFILPVDWSKRQFTLSWKQASSIDWGTIMLFGGGLALGDLMFKTGLARAIGAGLMALTHVETLWGITALAIFAGIVITETTSNTASATMIIPIMIALAQSSGVSPIPPALGACLGASYGFMLPVSTPPNAIVYGSGRVPITHMITTGILFDVVGFFLTLAGLRILCPLLGLI